jgi:glycosyltransferase involved in cell wall biosynthesis
MREISLHRLLRGPVAEPDRIALLSIWFKDHNNPRYAELLPRLERLDAMLLRLSHRQVPRGVQFRALRWPRRGLYRLALPHASKRYRGLLTLDLEQVPGFHGPIVADVDDPVFSPRAVAQLNDPNVKAYVVTAERAARRYEEMGVRKPHVVIPQGVSVSTLAQGVREEQAAHRKDGEVVVGWMAAHLLTRDDRDGANTLYNIDHLLELWDRVHEQVPNARLWLVGGASSRIEQRVQGREDIELFGRLPREQALATASNFDVSVYARERDQGIRAAKISEMIGLGVPTVSYDYEVTSDLRETGAGLLVKTEEEFVQALVSLLTDEARRASFAEAARRAGRELDWDVLADRFERDVLDVFLPRS